MGCDQVRRGPDIQLAPPSGAWPPIDRSPRTTWSGGFFTPQC